MNEFIKFLIQKLKLAHISIGSSLNHCLIHLISHSLIGIKISAVRSPIIIEKYHKKIILEFENIFVNKSKLFPSSIEDIWSQKSLKNSSQRYQTEKLVFKNENKAQNKK